MMMSWSWSWGWDVYSTLLSLITTSLTVCLVFMYIRRSRLDPLSAIPGPKPYPIVGNIYEMTQTEGVDIFLSWCEKFGKILKYDVLLLGTQVMICDAEALKRILVTNSSNYKKPETLLIPVRRIFGPRSVICLPGKEHAARRKILNPAFNIFSLRNKACTIVELTNKLMSHWHFDTVLQVQTTLSNLTLDILGNCMFGYDFNCIEEENNEIASTLRRLTSLQNMNLLRFLPFYKYLPTRMNRDLRVMKKLVKEIMTSKEAKMTSANESDADHEDMLDIMLRNMEGDAIHHPLSRDDIVDDIFLILVAGHETATNVMCWTLYELARHPEIQRECRQEVESVVMGGASLDYTSSSRLTVIECCIKEAMRLYPPVPLTSRQAINEDKLGGYTIPAGTVTALSIGALMKHPDYFTEPLRFEPSRFLHDSHANLFLPFLAGPAMCIGNKFAMLEMKLILAALLLRARFEIVPGSAFRGSHGLTYHMNPPLYLKVCSV